MWVQYIGGCSVHWGGGGGRGDIMIHVGEYYEYTPNIMSTLGVFSTSGDTMCTSGDIIIHMREQIDKSL